MAPDKIAAPYRERLDHRHRGRTCADEAGACERDTNVEPRRSHSLIPRAKPAGSAKKHLNHISARLHLRPDWTPRQTCPA